MLGILPDDGSYDWRRRRRRRGKRGKRRLDKILYYVWRRNAFEKVQPEYSPWGENCSDESQSAIGEDDRKWR